MSERQRTKVVVFGPTNHFGLPEGPVPIKLVEFIQWAQKLLEQVPSEHRDTVEIDIDSIGGYEGESHVEIEVAYWRPETDEEARDRWLDRQRRLRAATENARRRYEERLNALKRAEQSCPPAQPS